MIKKGSGAAAAGAAKDGSASMTSQQRLHSPVLLNAGQKRVLLQQQQVQEDPEKTPRPESSQKDHKNDHRHDGIVRDRENQSSSPTKAASGIALTGLKRKPKAFQDDEN